MTADDGPLIPDKHLQFILIHDEKNAVLGGSNMTGRYWSGSIWCYDDIRNFNRDKAVATEITKSGTCSGAYLEQDKFIIAEDNGELRIFQLCVTRESELRIQHLRCAKQTGDTILNMSPLAHKSYVVTGGIDCCIKVWNIPELIAVHSFNYAHTDIVTCVVSQPESESTFASTSLDNTALIWDIRQSKPAHCIRKSIGIGLTAVAWNIFQDNIVAIGAIDGSVELVDVRNLNYALIKSDVSSRSVHRLVFNPDPGSSEQLACCFDNTYVKVLDTNTDLSLVYKSDVHKDFVRDLACCYVGPGIVVKEQHSADGIISSFALLLKLNMIQETAVVDYVDDLMSV
ncbi:hypothetical protein KM043_015961 [Ampulex compressa]|nr:hypothetical protein KM043_015961 [Ampulex compressa]